MMKFANARVCLAWSRGRWRRRRPLAPPTIARLPSPASTARRTSPTGTRSSTSTTRQGHADPGRGPAPGAVQRARTTSPSTPASCTLPHRQRPGRQADDVTFEVRFRTEIRGARALHRPRGRHRRHPSRSPRSTGPGSEGLSLRQTYTVTMKRGFQRTDLTATADALRRAHQRGPAHHAQLRRAGRALRAGHLHAEPGRQRLRGHRGRRRSTSTWAPPSTRSTSAWRRAAACCARPGRGRRHRTSRPMTSPAST